MPVYQYHCTGCKHDFDAYVSIQERHSTLCPNCAHIAEMVITGGHFSIPGTDPAFPTAADKWAKRHRRANRHNLKDLGIPTD